MQFNVISISDFHFLGESMKRVSNSFLITTSFLLLLPTLLFAQSWATQVSGTTQTLNDVTFVNENYGWAVGNYGTMLHTTNGGTTWTAQTSGSGSWLYGVFFINSNLGWEVGNNGTIIHTTDGGTSWSGQSSGTTWTLNGVTFIDANYGWAVGGDDMLNQACVIVRTTNGGASWSEQTSGTTKRLYSVDFISANIGWAVGQEGTILHTTDGGTTWIPQTSGTGAWLYRVTFVDANSGWAVGGGGAIVHTTNGGTTWITQTSSTGAELYGVTFVNANNGWAVGWSGIIIHTTDGGTTWTAQSSGTSQSLNGIASIGSNNVWTVGDEGTILRYNDGLPIITLQRPNGGEQWRVGESQNITWTSANLSGNVTIQLKTAYPSGSWSSIATDIANTGSYNWTVSSPVSNMARIRIFATTSPTVGDTSNANFGILNQCAPEWCQQYSGTDATMKGVACAGTSDGWTVGPGGTVFHTSDAGYTWSAQTSGTTVDLNGICFTDSNNGWIVGYNGTILHATNGGQSWSSQTSGTTLPLYSVTFIDSNNGWAVGGYYDGYNEICLDIILHTTNGGQTWGTQRNGTSVLKGVMFTSLTGGWSWGSYYDYYAGGDIPTLLQTTNGGQTWNYTDAYFPNPDPESPYTNYHMLPTDVKFTSATNGWVAGTKGYMTGYGYWWQTPTVCHTTNGGVTWTEQPQGGYTINHMTFLNDNLGWLVGNNGIILNTTNGGTNWTTQSSGITQSLYDVFVTSSNSGWAVGAAGAILHHQPMAMFTVLSPNGGEILQIGNSQAISWTSQAAPENVELTINRNYPNGLWETIASSIANTGSYSWNATGPSTLLGRVRIRSVSNPGTYDVSDTSFAIVTQSPQPLTPDSSTLLLLHLDNSTDGAQGEVAQQAPGITFKAGRFQNAAGFAAGSHLTYLANGNMNSVCGTQEFWIRPTWNGNDSKRHVILSWGAGGGLMFFKTQQNTLLMMFNRWAPNGIPEFFAGGCSISNWLANQWHHVAFTWNADFVQIYIDGQRVAQTPTTITLPSITETTFQIGNDMAEANSDNLGATVDEFRISDCVRTSEELYLSYLNGLAVVALEMSPDSLHLNLADTSSCSLSVVSDMGVIAYPKTAATWLSSDTTVARVSFDGTITAISGGRAVITATVQDQSDSVIVLVSSPQPPDAPNDVVITPLPPHIKLTWSPITGTGIQYQVYRDSSTTGTFDLLIGSTADTSFVDSNAVTSSNQARFYQVHSVKP